MTRTATYSPDQLKAAFDLLILADYQPDWFRKDDQCTQSWLFDQLSSCEDAMPLNVCRELELSQGATYTEGVRAERENRQVAAGLVGQDTNEEAEQEARLAIKLISEDADIESADIDLCLMAANNLRHKAAVLEKAADLLTPQAE